MHMKNGFADRCRFNRDPRSANSDRDDRKKTKALKIMSSNTGA